MPQIVHLGARTGFVQELQMSQRQTWLIRRDMVWGQPLSRAFGAKPGLFVGSRVCGGPSGLGCTLGLHGWLRARRVTALCRLPLCCHSALQARDPTPPWEPYACGRPLSI